MTAIVALLALVATGAALAAVLVRAGHGRQAVMASVALAATGLAFTLMPSALQALAFYALMGLALLMLLTAVSWASWEQGRAVSAA